MTRPTKKPTVAEYLTQMLEQSEKTQRQIATEVGYDNPNVLSMFKTGATKVPVDMVGSLAFALEVDPKYLLRLVLTEYMPETYKSIERCLGTMILTDHETALIETLRSYSKDTDPTVLVFDDKQVMAVVIA